MLLARKCALVWIAVLVPDPFLATLLSFLATVCVWALAIVWKPSDKQMQLRSLQTVLLTLHVMMLLQASEHARPATTTVLHALWLAFLCFVLCAAMCSAAVRALVSASYGAHIDLTYPSYVCVQVVMRKLLSAPVAMVQDAMQMKGSRAKEASKAAFISSYSSDKGMVSRVYRVNRASVTATHVRGGATK